ncbi:MAG: hypothetical protein NZ927_07015 [Candidatus Calescibacterium sp.]|nr:hypothetical protein [Candidatus Calescibacterium sp.]MCX7733604.1 hypothetical protein [bacterium]MDW8088092.1 hypothetical protein [Candidatus Calescibacterium sp.]
MKELLEILITLFISFIFTAIIFNLGKLTTLKEKVVKDLITTTGERFEIMLKTRCIFSDNQEEVNLNGKTYICGNGKIQRQ